MILSCKTALLGQIGKIIMKKENLNLHCIIIGNNFFSLQVNFEEVSFHLNMDNDGKATN